MLGAQAFADPTLRHFDIQTQATASALNEFARQADITLVFSSALVAKHQAAGIKGDFTVLDGLRRLLDGTGLSFTQVSATTIAISAEAKAEQQAPPPANGPGTAPDPVGNGNQTQGDDNMNHRGLFTRIAALFALSGAALSGGHAYGQDTAAAPADASAANTSTLDEIVVTRNSSDRSMETSEVAELAAEIFGPERVQSADRLDDAIEAAVTLADEAMLEDVPGGAGVLITGSVITAGDARRLLAPNGGELPPEPPASQPSRHSFTAAELS